MSVVPVAAGSELTEVRRATGAEHRQLEQHLDLLGPGRASRPTPAELPALAALSRAGR